VSDVTFPDAGLHIAVLGKLLRARKIAEESLVALLKGIESSEEDWRDSERVRVQEAVRRLHAKALAKDDVASVAQLDFDGGNDIYMLIEQTLDVDSGGEEDYYEVRSLDGVGALTGLASLDLLCSGFRGSLEPLEALPKLTALRAPQANAGDVARLSKRGVSVDAS